jgi:hypothetical protein
MFCIPSNQRLLVAYKLTFIPIIDVEILLNGHYMLTHQNDEKIFKCVLNCKIKTRRFAP